MAEITVALIGLVGTVLAALIHRNRKKEKQEHGQVLEAIKEVKEDLKEDIASMNDDLRIIEAKLDTHIRDHAIGSMQKITTRKKTKKKKAEI
jgi:hypothetical protein